MITYTRTDVDMVMAQAAAGRGLWIGLHLQLDHPDHPVPRHAVLPWLPSDAHVTLLHLGRNRRPPDVEALFRACELIAHRGLVPTGAEFTGLGWFWRRKEPTLVAMINSAMLFRCRAALMRELDEEFGVRLEEQYGFIPHVTLVDPEPCTGPQAQDAAIAAHRRMAAALGNVPSFGVPLRPLAVVCGDACVRPTY